MVYYKSYHLYRSGNAFKHYSLHFNSGILVNTAVYTHVCAHTVLCDMWLWRADQRGDVCGFSSRKPCCRLHVHQSSQATKHADL